MVDLNYDEDQASNSNEVEWSDDGDGSNRDNSEVENDSSDLSVKLSLKHINKSNKKFRIAAVEDDDDSSESCKSDNSHFSQTSSMEPQGDPKLLQFSGSSSLNSKESSSASAIDPSIKNTNEKKPKDGNQIENKDMAMLVFNPCIMVFSPLFNVIMLTLTILMRNIDHQSFDELQIGQNPTNPTLSKNAEVSSWWKGTSTSNSSSLHSMMFEDNIGEDGLSAQSSYTLNINDSN
jgi:hypothetical protein